MSPLLPLIPFYFMRHGETLWNQKRLYMGSIDIPLNEEGITQAKKAAQLLKDEPITHIVASSLLRAQETADIAAKILNIPVTLIDALQECHLGEAQGRHHDGGVLLTQWRQGITPKDAETWRSFQNRILRGLQDALTINHNTLVISHGGVYQCLCKLMGWELSDLNNCETIFHNPPTAQGLAKGHPWMVCAVSHKAPREKKY